MNIIVRYTIVSTPFRSSPKNEVVTVFMFISHSSFIIHWGSLLLLLT